MWRNETYVLKNKQNTHDFAAEKSVKLVNHNFFLIFYIHCHLYSTITQQKTLLTNINSLKERANEKNHILRYKRKIKKQEIKTTYRSKNKHPERYNKIFTIDNSLGKKK